MKYQQYYYVVYWDKTSLQYKVYTCLIIYLEEKPFIKTEL